MGPNHTLQKSLVGLQGKTQEEAEEQVQVDTRVAECQMDMKSSQKLLNTQMDKAEYLVLLIKSQSSQRLIHLPALWSPVWIRCSSSIKLDRLDFGLNHQEMNVHLSHGIGQLSSLCGHQHILQNCSSDPAEDWDVAHDVEASGGLDVGDDPAGLLLISEPLPEVVLLLGVSETSDLGHQANTVRRDLIGCCRSCGYPEASRGKQVPPEEVCQQHMH
ncbi:hypothetical protein EYF80_060111 [Liparis tanakae]|uniref:Uncharacterized protein n=1 Tax=Liparis tanakae TaxID=230148 RepID=A0A4Z2EME7_9TELE|nr:hypothetical protein EYF80_060111 [Liparis tanakae]